MIFYLHIQEIDDFIVILTMDYLLFLVNGDLHTSLKVKQTTLCEIHKIKKSFYLCLKSANKELSIGSKAYHSLAKLYSAINMIPNNIRQD